MDLIEDYIQSHNLISQNQNQDGAEESDPTDQSKNSSNLMKAEPSQQAENGSVQISENYDIFDVLPEIANGIENIKIWSEKLRSYEICKQLGCVWSVRRGLTNDVPDKSIKYECTGLRGVPCFAKFQMVKESNQRYFLKLPNFEHTHAKLSEKEIEYKLSRIRSRKKQINLFKTLKTTSRKPESKEDQSSKNENEDLSKNKKKKTKDIITHNQKRPKKINKQKLKKLNEEFKILKYNEQNEKSDPESDSDSLDLILFDNNKDMSDFLIPKKLQQSLLLRLESQKQVIKKLEKQTKIQQQIIQSQRQQIQQIEKLNNVSIEKLNSEISSLKSEATYYQLEVKKLKQTIENMNE